MASKLKKKKRKWNTMDRPDTMDYNEALKDPAWDNERKWADAIMASNRRLGIDYFKHDKLTKGEGSCFPIAVVQQLNREEIFDKLREDLRHMARTLDHLMLREKVKDFICQLKKNHQKVIELKEIFNIDQAARVEAGEEGKTWEKYWENMLKDTEWADGYFLRATAWYLGMVLQIMDTKCNEKEPYYIIDGHFDDNDNIGLLYIGYVSEVHYQSLLYDYGADYLYDDIAVVELGRRIEFDFEKVRSGMIKY